LLVLFEDRVFQVTYNSTPNSKRGHIKFASSVTAVAASCN